jgi:hypothetical protein
MAYTQKATRFKAIEYASAPVVYTDAISPNSLTVITVGADVDIPSARTLSVYQVTLDQISARLGTEVIAWDDLTMEPGKKIKSDRVEVDTVAERTASGGVTVENTLKVDNIAERTASAGVTIEDKLILNSVASSNSAVKALYINDSNEVMYRQQSGLPVAEFIDDFSSGVVTQSNALDTSFVNFDKPWIMYYSHPEVDILMDYGAGTSTSANPYNDMVGAAFVRWTTPSDLTNRFFAMNNGYQVSPALGYIEAVFRLNLRYISHASISNQDMSWGLGRNMCSSADFNLNGVVAFKYSSTEANWGYVYAAPGAGAVTGVFSAVPADEFTHTFKITISTSGADSTVNWYVDSLNIGTQTISNLARLGPRILHRYTKTGSALPGDGLGVVLDAVKITQNYSRGF